MAPLLKAYFLLPLLLASSVLASSYEKDKDVIEEDGIDDGSDISVQLGLQAGVTGGEKGSGADIGLNAAVGLNLPYDEKLVETEYIGVWHIDCKNVGVAAMQLQLMPNNKVVWFDTTSLGDSARKLDPPGRNCPINVDQGNKPDCFAHAVAYDAETGESRTVYFDGDPWCSSGNLLPNGDLLASGGTKSGFRSVRVLVKDDPVANFVERKMALADNRWYASNQVLEDGSTVVVGGRDSYSYEILPPALVPPQLEFKPRRFDLPFLQQTTTPKINNAYVENNLYPFLFLMPDGNLFLFANNRAISFNPQTAQVIREYPMLPGGARNYPPSGMAALLPLELTPDVYKPVCAWVVICGGNSPDAFFSVDAKHTHEKVFMTALTDCHRIEITKQGSTWERDQDMPSPRTMGDLQHLPTGDLLMVNGAQKGTSGWEDGKDPNFTPVLYMPKKPMGQRFKALKPTQIARMYHSCSALLPDGKILVAGSNPHEKYTFIGDYPTELRVEKFSPPYLDPKLDNMRPAIAPSVKTLKYGQELQIAFTLKVKEVSATDFKVTMVAPPFTTHGFSMNQRSLVLGIKAVVNKVVTVVAPPSGKIAPPGYYMLFMNYRGVPSKGVWVNIA